MKQPTLLERLLIIFSKKKFKRYIDKQAYYRYKDSIDTFEARAKGLEFKTESILEQITDTTCNGIVHPYFNEIKFTMVKNNMDLSYCPPEKLNESYIPETITTFSVEECYLNRIFTRMYHNVKFFDDIKCGMASQLIDNLIANGYITYEKRVNGYDACGKESFLVTAKLKVFK